MNDYELVHLPYNQDCIYASFNGDSPFEQKIIYNLPFARRGYVFKNEEIQQFYNSIDWYRPNPDYLPNVDELTPIEKQWLNYYKQ